MHYFKILSTIAQNIKEHNIEPVADKDSRTIFDGLLNIFIYLCLCYRVQSCCWFIQHNLSYYHLFQSCKCKKITSCIAKNIHFCYTFIDISKGHYGFPNYSTFYKAYKKHFGHAPSAPKEELT